MGGGMVPRTLELHPSTLRRLVRLAKEAERAGFGHCFVKQFLGIDGTIFGRL